MRYFLALSFLLFQSLCFADHREINEFEQSGYKIELIEHDGHEYLIVRMKHTNNFTIIHYPECKTCINWPIDISQYQGCVEVQNNGKYTIDQSGCYEI